MEILSTRVFIVYSKTLSIDESCEYVKKIAFETKNKESIISNNIKELQKNIEDYKDHIQIIFIATDQPKEAMNIRKLNENIKLIYILSVERNKECYLDKYSLFLDIDDDEHSKKEMFICLSN